MRNHLTARTKSLQEKAARKYTENKKKTTHQNHMMSLDTHGFRTQTLRCVCGGSSDVQVTLQVFQSLPLACRERQRTGFTKTEKNLQLSGVFFIFFLLPGHNVDAKNHIRHQNPSALTKSG